MAEAAKPLVSVAIITYNQEDYLEECLDSVLAQDYRPLEIVVADDGSTDGTRAIIERYAAAYPALIVPVLAERNGGVTANSTAAHRSCTGRYIAWLGGDDVMLPGKIARQVARMEEDATIALCYHDLDVFDSESGRTLHRFSQLNRPREGGIAQMLRHGPFNGGSATMVRRSHTPDGFDPRIPISSDWLYWSQTLRLGGGIAYLPDVLGRYRRHRANVTAHESSSRRLVEDHLNSAMILMLASPLHVPDISWYLARLMFNAARYGEGGRPLLRLFGIAVAAASVMLSVARFVFGPRNHSRAHRGVAEKARSPL